MMDSNEFRECLEKFIEKTNQIINQFNDLEKQINKHHTHCNIAKTVGTSAGILGSITAVSCFIAAPFTLGNWAIFIHLIFKFY